jgi:hypothetical protein
MGARSESSGVGAFDPRPAAGILFVTLAGAILVFQLFVPPIVGIADNYDYGRILGRFGLMPQVSTREDRYFGWLVRKYDLDPQKVFPYGPSSSQTLLVSLAIRADRLVTHGSTIDIRAVGAVNAFCYLVCLALIAAAGRRLPAVSYVALLALLVLAGTDVAYVSFFNSFYSEPAALIGLAGSIGFALLAGSRPGIAVPGVLVCSLLSVLAKPQYALLSLPLAVVIVCCGRQTARRRWIAASLVGAVVLVGASLIYLSRTPTPLKRAYLYDIVFYEILPRSPAPARDLDELGLDHSLLDYSGTIAYQRNALRNPQLDRDFYPRISLRGIARFYSRHPIRLLRLLERSSRSAFRMRPGNLGNFEKSTGVAPGSRSRAFSLWSAAKARLLPGSLAFLSFFFLANVALAAIVRRAITPPGAVIALWGALLVVAAEQFLICGAGEGDYELVRHLYLFHAAFDALLIGDVVALTSLAAIGLRRSSLSA